MKRLPTSVPGLDDVLHGGLFEGGVYILEGPPGVGKTTLANQMAYAQAKAGAATLYVTMLAESHSRMLQHMEDQTFFDHEMVNSKVFYVSGYRELDEGGLRALVGLLRGELSRSKARLLVVDGLVVDLKPGSSDDTVRQFVHELQSLVTAMDCTCLLLTSISGRGLSAEQTMVDGIFSFEDHAFQWRTERRLQVRKFRGSEVVRGKHTFCITHDGLRVYPRFEAVACKPGCGGADGIVASGIPRLDELLRDGGLQAGTSTLLVGATGCGKTNLAAAFALAGQPAVMFTGAELPEEMGHAVATLAPGLPEAVEAGRLKVERLNPGDESLDQMAHKILDVVDRFQAVRLSLDGLPSLADTLAFPDRGYRFVGCLLQQLKSRGVTTFFTMDPHAMAAATSSTVATGVSAWFDNLLELRHDVEGVESHRTLLVRKLRGARSASHRIDVHMAA